MENVRKEKLAQELRELTEERRKKEKVTKDCAQRRRHHQQQGRVAQAAQ